MKSAVLLSLAACVLFGGGYKIPETSLNSVALSAATVAHSNGADAAYYNPANMVFMKNENVLEANLLYIGLSDVEYKSAATTINAKREDFIVPSLHYVSQDVNGMRFGLSVVSPAGLSKRWNSAPAIYSAEEFTLQTVELNPTVAFKINEKTAVALGVRAIYSEGVVKNSRPGVSLDMNGDSIDIGYNLALSYKAAPELEMALAYRSKVDLSVEGDVTLNTLQKSASVSIPVPALLNIAVAYTLPSKTTFEFVYERNYWSKYKELDFDFGQGLPDPAPIPKNWKDTNAFRFGVTQKLDALTLMGGVVIDESPVPEATLGFELPDSDSVSVSLGVRYQINEKLNVGLAALYSMREEREVTNSSLNGEFSNANVLIIASALEYRF